MKTELVNNSFTKSKLDFLKVMERLKSALKLSSDAELSRILGMSASNFSNRKASNSFPFDAVVPVCIDKAISLDWIFTGVGKKTTNTESSENVNFLPIDPMLLGEILSEIGYSQSDDFSPTEESWKRDYVYSRKHAEDTMMGIVGGTIYNNVGALKGEKQKAAIFSEVTRLADATRLFNMQMDAAQRQKKG